MEIYTVTLDKSKNPQADYLKGTFHWHIDDTTSDVPAKATTLTARHVAMVGGETEFANTYAAYEDLPDNERKRYEGLRVVHSLQASQRLVNPITVGTTTRGMAPGSPEGDVTGLAPQGRTLLVGDRCHHRPRRRHGAPPGSRALLDELLAWSTQERFCYVHEWQVGDVVVWDNTGMLHRALPYDPASERTMQRTTIAGDEPWG